MSWHHFIHMVHTALKAMPKLKEPKDPIIAAIVGFLGGPIGIGIYFKSWSDFFVSFCLIIALGILIPGVGLIPGWIFSAIFAYLRAERH